MGWIGCAIQQVTSKGLPGFLFRFNILIFIYFFEYETISAFAPTFWTHIISELDGVSSLTFNVFGPNTCYNYKPIHQSFDDWELTDLIYILFLSHDWDIVFA